MLIPVPQVSIQLPHLSQQALAALPRKKATTPRLVQLACGHARPVDSLLSLQQKQQQKAAHQELLTVRPVGQEATVLWLQKPPTSAAEATIRLHSRRFAPSVREVATAVVTLPPLLSSLVEVVLGLKTLICLGFVFLEQLAALESRPFPLSLLTPAQQVTIVLRARSIQHPAPQEGTMHKLEGDIWGIARSQKQATTQSPPRLPTRVSVFLDTTALQVLPHPNSCPALLAHTTPSLVVRA